MSHLVYLEGWAYSGAPPHAGTKHTCSPVGLPWWMRCCPLVPLVSSQFADKPPIRGVWSFVT